ncbi:RluA family pseudouridine synthase [Desulfothermobacter acidiphilus]|uniref:RluA family pseudouridine synthase n=1 Tax=Desulfothermobacter acidiphilus TaxID=1938353 RepID=UPI003F8B3D01
MVLVGARNLTLACRLRVEESEVGLRLDLYLARNLAESSRSYLQRLINEGYVKVEGRRVKPSYRVKLGEEVLVFSPPTASLKLEPEPLPLEIIYEDEEVLVVNKPRGMVVHPGAGCQRGTLVNALLYHCRQLSSINGVLRPGIVHRLDKDTSGLLVVAKTDAAHLSLSAQFQERRVVKEYLALVYGEVQKEEGMIEAPIGRHPRQRKKMSIVEGGRQARTFFQVVERFLGYTLLRLRPETGRTHQIRVHLHYLGHPVVGDLKYGPARPHLGLEGQFLHAKKLGFFHPRTGAFMCFEAPLPPELERVLAELRARRAGDHLISPFLQPEKGVAPQSSPKSGQR